MQLITRRRVAFVLGIAGVAGGFYGYNVLRFPSDKTPEGVYFRIALAISHGDPRPTFPYLEDQAQHSCFTIKDYRKRASERIAASYPEPERSKLLAQYRAHAEASDGADIWVEMALRLGWMARLRRDSSGIAKVETAGDRATVETVRGTRYTLRRRENGIWGLSVFTGELMAEAERAARDWDVVEQAALDYDRAR